jgi:ribosomal protein S27AE
MEAQEQRKILRKKCPRCYRIEGSQWIPKREVNIAMSRLYVKRKIAGKWKWYEVGWLCLNCGYVEIEHSHLPKVKTYKSLITTDWDFKSFGLEEMETCPTCGAKLEEDEKEEVALRWKAITEAYREALKKPRTLGLG